MCGSVASTHFASSSNKQPTFLNLDKPYPNPIFTIVIWCNDRSKFGNPETKYANKRGCVNGLIEDYRGALEVIADEPGQICERSFALLRFRPGKEAQPAQ